MTKNQRLEERAAALFKDFENGKAYQGTLGLRVDLLEALKKLEPLTAKTKTKV